MADVRYSGFTSYLPRVGLPGHENLHPLPRALPRDLAADEPARVAALVHQPDPHAEIAGPGRRRSGPDRTMPATGIPDSPGRCRARASRSGCPAISTRQGLAGCSPRVMSPFQNHHMVRPYSGGGVLEVRAAWAAVGTRIFCQSRSAPQAEDASQASKTTQQVPAALRFIGTSPTISRRMQDEPLLFGTFWRSKRLLETRKGTRRRFQTGLGWRLATGNKLKTPCSDRDRTAYWQIVLPAVSPDYSGPGPSVSRGRRCKQHRETNKGLPKSRKESAMPKFYVESGPVRLIFDAATAEQAAVMAFQWTCDKQAEIEAASPLDHLLEAEERGWQLGDEVAVNEQGFGRWDGEVFETLDIFEAWLRSPLPVV